MSLLFNIGKKKADNPLLNEFFDEARKVIHGKERELRLALSALLARGHILIEDLPGMGKTTFVMVLAQLTGMKMSRIQFTNDLLPSDVLGANIYEPQNQKFRFHPGPIFSNIVLGDELNRASSKSQSAFLQAMEERAVTVEGTTHPLPEPFFIIATQNPQTQVGTHALPESQLDRFLMKISLGYPDRQSEFDILKNGDPRNQIKNLKIVLNRDVLLQQQQLVEKVHTSKALIEYVQDLLIASRSGKSGLSPRAGIMLLSSAKAWAHLSGRDLVLPEDIQDIAVATWAHRLPTQSEAEIRTLIEHVKVP